MFSRNPLDWGLLVLYFGFLVVVWRRGRRASEASDYLVAGRRLTLPAFVATLVATWYGGILGIGEYTWRYGVSNWLVFGVPYYVGALLFSWAFARRVREAQVYTLPDLLDRAYGRGPALVGALAMFVNAAPAAYLLMLGTLFASMFGVPLLPCIVAAALFSVFYLHGAGLRNAVLTDRVYVVLMYLGFAVMLAFLFARFGGPQTLPGRLPASHFTWHGGNGAGAVIVWYFIALSALVDPAFWQDASAARDPRTARRGVAWAVAFWIVFDFMTTTTGLYARALLPELENPVFAFPELARLALPPVALGLFYLGLIATVMSTIDSYAFIAATTLARDVAWRLKPSLGEARVPALVRLGLWVTAAFAAALAMAEQSIVALWKDLGSLTTPVLLLPAGTALLNRGRLGPRATLYAMLAPFAVSLVWIVARRAAAGRPPAFPFTVEPIYAGLGASLLCYASGWLFAKESRS